MATLVFKKVIDVIPQIFGGTLSLPMSASLRPVPSFLQLLKSPIILVCHSPSLQRPRPLAAPQGSSPAPSDSHTQELPIAIRKGEAMSDPGWRQAMVDEMSALHSNGTWDLVPLPDGKT
ncbi:hypothetical protein A2U01_0045707, partial [Trifolium medium]|nr:hypothetical protein [Trifolium medium]